MIVPRGALVLVLDGAELRLLRNRGEETGPDLEAVPHDRLRRCGTRAPARPGDGPLRYVIDAVDPLIAAGTPLILVAPPEGLGALRAELPPRARRHVVGELGGDLGRCTPRELAEHLQLSPS